MTFYNRFDVLSSLPSSPSSIPLEPIKEGSREKINILKECMDPDDIDEEVVKELSELRGKPSTLMHSGPSDLSTVGSLKPLASYSSKSKLLASRKSVPSAESIPLQKNGEQPSLKCVVNRRVSCPVISLKSNPSQNIFPVELPGRVIKSLPSPLCTHMQYISRNCEIEAVPNDLLGQLDLNGSLSGECENASVTGICIIPPHTERETDDLGDVAKNHSDLQISPSVNIPCQKVESEIVLLVPGDVKHSDEIFPKWQSILEELSQAEHNYRRYLRLLFTFITTNAPLHDPDKKLLSSGLERLIQLSELVLQCLSPNPTDMKTPLHMADKIGNFFSQSKAEFASAYSTYIRCYHSSIHHRLEQLSLASNGSESDSWKMAQEEFIYHSENFTRQSISSIYRLPVQHMSRYSLHLEAFYKAIKNSIETDTCLKDAINAMKEICSIIDQISMTEVSKLKLFSIYSSVKSCPAEIISGQRTYLMELDAMHYIRHETLTEIPSPPVRVRCYLLNDLILIAKIKSKSKEFRKAEKEGQLIPWKITGKIGSGNDKTAPLVEEGLNFWYSIQRNGLSGVYSSDIAFSERQKDFCPRHILSLNVDMVHVKLNPHEVEKISRRKKGHSKIQTSTNLDSSRITLAYPQEDHSSLFSLASSKASMCTVSMDMRYANPSDMDINLEKKKKKSIWNMFKLSRRSAKVASDTVSCLQSSQASLYPSSVNINSTLDIINERKSSLYQESIVSSSMLSQSRYTMTTGEGDETTSVFTHGTSLSRKGLSSKSESLFGSSGLLHTQLHILESSDRNSLWNELVGEIHQKLQMD